MAPFNAAIDLHNKNIIYIHSINTDVILFQAPPQSPKAPTFIDSAKTNIITANKFIQKAQTYLKLVQKHTKDELVKIEKAIEKCSTEQVDNVFEKFNTWAKNVEDIIVTTQDNIKHYHNKITTFRK